MSFVKTLGLLVGMMMIVPIMGGMATAESDAEEIHDADAKMAEMQQELMAEWLKPSPLTAGDANDLLAIASEDASQLAPEDALNLMRYLRDNPASDLAGMAMRDSLAAKINKEFSNQQAGRVEVQMGPWEKDTWDTVGILGLTPAYLLGAAATGDANLIVPDDIQLIDFLLNIDVASGQVGCFPCSSGYIYVRAVADLLAAVAWDVHQTTDTALLQLPVAIELRLNWSCSFWWGIPTCSFWFSVHFNNIEVAHNAQYAFASGAASGHIATRATDHDIYQVIYDALGHVNHQKAPEWTSEPGDRDLPYFGDYVHNLHGQDTPGIGDLHAAAPQMNYYGLQKDASTPEKEAFPTTDPTTPTVDGVIASAEDRYDGIHTRNQGEYGTSPHDSTGMMAAFTMNSIRAWELNIAILRWKNVGTSYADQAEAPMSFYYDAERYFTGASGNIFTALYNIADQAPDASGANVPGLL